MGLDCIAIETDCAYGKAARLRKGLCQRHYGRQLRHGTTALPVDPEVTVGINKRCKICHLVKAVNEFYQPRASYCMECDRTRACDYANSHPVTPEAKADRAAGARVRYMANRDAILEYRHERYKANREVSLAYSVDWYRKNRKRRRDRQAEWTRNNPDKVRVHRQRYHARKLAVPTVEFSADLLAQRWSYYGNKCWVCRNRAEATDHVKPLNKGGAHMLCNLRPICTSCNSSKRDKWPYRTGVRR